MPPSRRIRFAIVRCAVLSLLLWTQIASAQIRDGGINPANLGKGDWIYILANAVNHLGGNSPAVTNLASLMAYEKNQGVQYLIIKAGDGPTKFPSDVAPQFTAEVVDAGHAAGLKIFGYDRSAGVDIPGEIALVDYVFNQGADGFVFDAESEWESQNLPNNTIAATNLCAGVRAHWPNKFLAHSPFAIISGHSSFPYKEFGFYCDAAMPQDYWIEFGFSASSTVSQMSSEWRNWQAGLGGIWTNAIKPIVPAGQGWSSASGTITAAQITEFVNALKTDPNPATKGGYKGANYWRAELHPADVLAAIRTNNIGDAPAGAPILTNVTVASVSDTSVVITWTTDQNSDNVVEYGLSAAYGSGATNSSFLYFHTLPVGGLSPNTTYHFRAVSRNAASQASASADYVFTTLAAAVPDLIIDDGNVVYGGAWSVGSSTSGFSGTEYRFASTAAGGAATATFRPTINTSGNYDVFIWYLAGSNRATNSPWTIDYNGGTQALAVDQTANGGSWRLLAANKNFAAGTNGFIRLSNDTGFSGKVVISDAVKLVYLPPPPSAPSIATQPQNQVVNQGNTATFTVVASGSGPLYYQWRKGGVPLAGATGTSYSKINAQPADVGIYSVLVTNGVNSIVSSNASLTVNVPPAINGQPQSVVTNTGSDVTFSVSATGTAPLSYYWQFNHADIPGAFGSNYTRLNAQPADAGVYTVMVSNVAGTTLSLDATLGFLQANPPHIDWISLLSAGNAQIQISGGPGNFAIETAPELAGWTQLISISATTAVFQYTDPETNQAGRFYRVRVLP
jgi:hypothetical protein